MNIEKGKAMLNSVIGKSRKSPLLNLKKNKKLLEKLLTKNKKTYIIKM
jgi:hypothetical protein